MYQLQLLLLLALLKLQAVLCFPSLKDQWRKSSLAAVNSTNSYKKRQTGYRRIDTSGPYAFNPPGPGDKRGPCPALNALANHNYFPHDGVVTLLQGAQVPADIYGIGLELSTVLSVMSVVISGDWSSLTWSIGGPQSPGGLIGALTSPLLGSGQGLSRSHNKYETDASVTHGDFSISNGDVDSVAIPKFKYLLDLQAGKPNPNYDFDVLTTHRAYTLQDSISRNPYFFYGPVSGLLVSNAGHCFVSEMMSNFTADHPNGLLDKKTLMTFFAMSENPTTGALTHKKGWERIPDNWYRRPAGLKPDYGTVAFLRDLVRMGSKVPQLYKIGGNTNGVNTFTGVDLSNIFGSAYSLPSLLNPARLLCFFYRSILAVTPDMIQGGIVASLLSTGFNILNSYILPLVPVDPLCPDLTYNGYLLDSYPGASVGPN